ncbi:MAG: hypothetical protein H6737_21315 [Alphaproteobacteria bacterium]|nr:hypothetical protein [Alphaproteobacteria bacterium]
MWLLVSLAFAEPTVDVSAGLGMFAQANAPWRANPAAVGQVDVPGLLDSLPWLAASGNVELGAYIPYGCDYCKVSGIGRIGVGPTVTTRWVDGTLLGRVDVGTTGRVQVKPAIQANARIPGPAGTTVRPYLGLEGTRYLDVYTGVRVGTTVVGEGTRTRPRQCEEGTLRTLDGPVQSGSVRGIAPMSPGDVRFDYGEAYQEELANPLGEFKNNVGDALALMGAYQSYRALKQGEAGVSDLAGRAQDVAGKNGWDWSIPLSAADLPGALATVELEIGKRAIDALIPHLEKHRERILFGAHLDYRWETTTFECVPQQICEGGWWTDAGWVLKGAPTTTTSRGFTEDIRVPSDRTRRGEIWAVWTQVGRFYRNGHPGIGDAIRQMENPCGVSDVFEPGVEVEQGPSQDECEDWLRTRAGLESERRALVGSYLDLHREQLEWADSQARQDCDDAKASAAFWAKSAATRAEIAGIAGDADSAAFAEVASTQAAEAQAAADRACGWASEVKERLGESETAVEDRPGRLEEIEAEKAELDAKIATCNLVE